MKLLSKFLVIFILAATIVTAQNKYYYKASSIEMFNTNTTELLSYDYSPNLTVEFTMYEATSTGWVTLSSGAVIYLNSYVTLGEGYYKYSAKMNGATCNVVLSFAGESLLMTVFFKDIFFRYMLWK